MRGLQTRRGAVVTIMQQPKVTYELSRKKGLKAGNKTEAQTVDLSFCEDATSKC